MMRRGYTSDDLLQSAMKKQDKQIDEKIDETASALIKKQQTAQEITTSRLRLMSSCNVLRSGQEEMESYKRQIEELRSICKTMQSALDQMDQDVQDKQQTVEKLTKNLEALRIALQRIPSRYEQPLLQLGSGVCENISGSLRSQQQDSQ
jgi:prefoldin subunit 5